MRDSHFRKQVKVDLNDADDRLTPVGAFCCRPEGWWFEPRSVCAHWSERLGHLQKAADVLVSKANPSKVYVEEQTLKALIFFDSHCPLLLL